MDEPHALEPGRRMLVTIAVMLAVLIQVLDTTIANVALPHMQASLGATQDSINWVLTSYIVASAIAIPIAGWLADKIGRKRLLITAVICFTIASFLCAIAQSLTEMVAFRALQGISGAFLVPLSQATLFDIYPREKHSQAMALFGGGIMIGPILGPLPSGAGPARLAGPTSVTPPRTPGRSPGRGDKKSLRPRRIRSRHLFAAQGREFDLEVSGVGLCPASPG